MPRDASGVYSAAWIPAAPGTKIQSARVNQMVTDFTADANGVRPISAGGTGGGTVTEAREALAIGGYSPLEFGAAGDGATDDTAELQAAINAAIAIADGAGSTGLVTVDGGGRRYAISAPLTLGAGVLLANMSLIALPSASWTTTNAMVEATTGFSIRVERVFLFAEKQAHNCLYVSVGGNVGISDCLCRNFKLRGYWIADSVIMLACRADQYTASDPDLNDPAKRTGYPLYLDAGATDTKIIGGVFHNGLAPLYVAATVHNITIIGAHIYQNRTDGTPWANSSIADIYGYQVTFAGCYLDLGAINYYVTGSTPAANLIVEGCFSVYNATIATFDAWVRLHTTVASSTLQNVKVSPTNIWAGDRAVPVLQLNATGAGSWTVHSRAQDVDEDLMTVRSRLALANGDGTADIMRIMGGGSFALYRAYDANTTVSQGVEFGSNGDDAVVRTGGAAALRVRGTDKVTVTAAGVQLSSAASTAAQIVEYDGNPEGALTASSTTICVRRDGAPGTAIYFRAGGASGNTGWVAIA